MNFLLRQRRKRQFNLCFVLGRVFSEGRRWEVDVEEINQELEEICGEFTSFDSPLNPSNNTPSDSLSSSNSLSSNTPLLNNTFSIDQKKTIERKNFISENNNKNSDESNNNQTQQTHKKTISNRNISKTKSILFLSTSSLSSTSTFSSSSSSSLLNKESNSTMNILNQYWDGTIPSLLNHLNSLQYDGIIVLFDSKSIDIITEQILKLIQRSCPVIILNISNPLEGEDSNGNSIKYLNGFDYKSGIRTAIRCLEDDDREVK